MKCSLCHVNDNESVNGHSVDNQPYLCLGCYCEVYSGKHDTSLSIAGLEAGIEALDRWASKPTLILE